GADLPVHHPLDGATERRAGDGRGDSLALAVLQLARGLANHREIDAGLAGDGLDLAEVERALVRSALSLELRGAVEDGGDLFLAVAALCLRLSGRFGPRHGERAWVFGWHGRRTKPTARPEEMPESGV